MNGSSIEGRVAIVTGAARGIGGASAIELAARGADIVVNDLSPSSGAERILHAIESCGRRAIFVQGDVTRREVNLELVERAVEQFGRVDIVVSNAGRGLRGAFVDLDPDAARQLFDLIFWSGFQLAQ